MWMKSVWRRQLLDGPTLDPIDIPGLCPGLLMQVSEFLDICAENLSLDQRVKMLPILFKQIDSALPSGSHANMCAVGLSGARMQRTRTPWAMLCSTTL